MGTTLSYADLDEAVDAVRGLPAADTLGLVRGERLLRSCCRTSCSTRSRCSVHFSRRPRRRQRQPAVHGARTRTPAQGLRRQGDRHPRELRAHARRSHRTRPMSNTVVDHGCRVTCCPRPRAASSTSSLRRVKQGRAGLPAAGFHDRFNDALAQGAGKTVEPIELGYADIALPAVHGRHDGRFQGCDAEPSQHGLQRGSRPSTGRANSYEGVSSRIVAITALPLYHIFSLENELPHRSWRRAG